MIMGKLVVLLLRFWCSCCIKLYGSWASITCTVCSIMKSPFLEMLCSSSLRVPRPLPSTQVLENVLVLRKILNYLPARDLHSASRVNRLWCTESRSVLGDHRRCFLDIHSTNPCEELVQAAKLLRDSNQPLPFNGFYFDFDFVERNHIPCLQGIEKVHESLQLLMSSFKVKYVKVKTLDNDSPYTCLATQFVCDLIEQHAADIEELDFERCPHWLGKRFTVHGSICGGRRNANDDEDVSDEEKPTLFFPSLRNLKMSPTYQPAFNHSRQWCFESCPERHIGMVIRKIVQAAPNLACISRTWDAADMLLLPVPKWSLIQILEVGQNEHYEEEVWNSLRVKVPTSSMSNLTRLSVHSLVVDILLTLENCATILQPIINGSKQTLRHIKIPYCVLKKLDQVTMETVDCVDIEMHEAPWDTPIDLPLFRWTQFFPNMRTLSISILDDSMNMCTCHQAYAGIAELSSTLKTLRMDTERFTVATATFPDFASCFPQLITLSWRAMGTSYSPQYLPHMWHYWSNLQRLTLDLVCWQLVGNHLDLLAEAKARWCVAFAGISYEEVKALRGESDEFLRQVMLIPSTYSMLHLKDLKSFGINLNEANGTLIESKLSRALVFSRMKGLRLSYY